MTPIHRKGSVLEALRLAVLPIYKLPNCPPRGLIGFHGGKKKPPNELGGLSFFF